ncbi:MAG TPA: hypothetical protein VIE64_00090 [Solirubrobacterales bacterium]
MGQVRKRLTYANVVSSIALFIAVGGATTYAAQQIADKSVGERQLRPGAVTASKLRKNAVIAPKIKALAVKGGKLANGAVTVNKLGTGAVARDKLADGAVTGEKIANDTVTGDKIVESSMGEVPSANKSNSAKTAESANPVIFAEVNQDGSVDSSNSKGITSADVSTPGKGNVYCIKVPGFNPKGGQVTPQVEPTYEETIAHIKIAGVSCPAPAVEVQTFKLNTMAKPAAFYVVLYN